MIGRDWTHQGVAKLFTDITNNGYQLLYLTSRSVGQADTTRGYLKSIVQGKYTIPEGPVIMSPDRTFTALRRYFTISSRPNLIPLLPLYVVLIGTQGGDITETGGFQDGLFTRFTTLIPPETNGYIVCATIESLLCRFWKSDHRCSFL